MTASDVPTVVFEETGKERKVIGRCGRCQRTKVFIFDPNWRGAIVSPRGVMHIGCDGGETACGLDATGPEWWWPL